MKHVILFILFGMIFLAGCNGKTNGEQPGNEGSASGSSEEGPATLGEGDQQISDADLPEINDSTDDIDSILDELDRRNPSDNTDEDTLNRILDILENDSSS